MGVPVLFRSSREPEYKFSYAVRCYPVLWNPHLATHPLSEFCMPSIKEKLREPDETGRFQVLGIYQQSLARTKEERAEQLRNEHFVELIIREGGKDNPLYGFDHVRRDLILVAYEDTNEKEFQRKVERKLSKKDLEERNRLLETLEDVATKLIGHPLDEKRQIRNIDLHEHMSWYFRNDDILRRLSIHHIDNLPDVLQKDTSFIRNFYRKIQGKDYENLGEYLDEAQRVVEKARHIRDTYGLTRDEAVLLEGSVENIIAFLKGKQNLL